MKPKILAVGGGLCISALVLASCGKQEPTAEELLQQTYTEAEVNFIDAEYSATVELKPNLKGDSSDTDDSITSSLVQLDGTMQATQDKTHFSYECSTKSGDNESIYSIESYGVASNSMMQWYTLTSEDNIWTTHSEDYYTELSHHSLIGFNDLSVFNDYTLDASGDDYVIDTKINFEKLINSGNVGLGYIIESILNIDSTDISDVDLSAVLVYDKADKTLKDLTFKVEPVGLKNGTLILSKYEVKVHIKETGSKTIDIPDDIITSAVSLSEDVSTKSIEEAETEIGEVDCISRQLFSVDYLYSEDLVDILSNYYTEEFDDLVIYKLTKLCNCYNPNELRDHLLQYSSWEDDEKTALAILVDLEILSKDTIEELVDINDLSTYISALESSETE